MLKTNEDFKDNFFDDENKAINKLREPLLDKEFHAQNLK